MYAETSCGDDPFAKVKGLISDMIARLEEKASVDVTHKAFEAKHVFNSIHSEIEMMRSMTMSQHRDLSLMTSMISLGSYTMQLNFVASLAPCLRKRSHTIGYRDMLNFLEAHSCCAGFDACSLQSISNVSVEYAGPLGDQEAPGEHRTGPWNEVSARYETRQRSDAVHQLEDQVD